MVIPECNTIFVMGDFLTDHHLFCSMQGFTNGVLIDKVPKVLAFNPSETIYAIQIIDHSTYLIIIPLKLNEVTSYFDVRKPTQEKYEDQNILKIELTMKAPP